MGAFFICTKYTNVKSYFPFVAKSIGIFVCVIVVIKLLQLAHYLK